MSREITEKGRGGIPFHNPGFAGNTGEFNLSEEEVRGVDYVGVRSTEGAHPGGTPTYPYMLVEKNPSAPLFDGAHLERYEKIRSRFPDAQGALLPVLNLAQELRGHISPGTMREVAGMLGLAEAYVRGVATFYTMYNKRPVGRFLIQVCTNISCNLCGGDEVLAAFLRELSIDLGATTDDGMFTVTEVECLAACGTPTAVQINSRYFENVTPDSVPELLERLRAEAN